jgi:hypothetical protein
MGSDSPNVRTPVERALTPASWLTGGCDQLGLAFARVVLAGGVKVQQWHRRNSWTVCLDKVICRETG